MAQKIDWQTIDTILLDMDGTLLDLHFDLHFWFVKTLNLVFFYKKLEKNACNKKLIIIWNNYRAKFGVNSKNQGVRVIDFMINS